MSKIIAIANQKGGVGKTTTTINLGAALAGRGESVLLLDFDPQCSLTISCGIEAHQLENSVYNALIGRPAGVSLDSITVKTDEANISLVPSGIDLARADMELAAELMREGFLKRAIDCMEVDYDFILIDCPPSLGILTTNALVAADELLIPVEADYLAFKAMQLLLHTTFPRVREQINKKLELAGILVTKYQARTTHSKEIMEAIRQAHPNKVFTSVITAGTRLRDASAAGRSLLAYEPKSPQSDEYRGLAEEIAVHAEAN
ncbi:MAG: hypothetical protein DRP46_11755 [Candidatus Zixiibacteriota bacterium]|nr:MAG: hypothetical protein DRP46_11755 [candidate division Zixibacteria bacterium]